MLNASRLRHVVTIQKKGTGKDPFGAPLPGWVDVWTTIPAEVIPLSAREFMASANEHAQVSARITIRWREGMDATMRIIHRGTIYNIAGVLPDNASGLEYITLPVTAGVNDG